MRSFRKLTPNPAAFVVARQTHLLPSSSSFHSSSDDGGGGGRGRGRGRGAVVTPFSPPDTSSSTRVPGMPPLPQDRHPTGASGRDRGRGVGGPNPPSPSSTIPPSFVSPPRLDVSLPAGRGHGRAAALDPGSQQPKKPIFVRPAERQVARDDEPAPTVDLPFHQPGAGRGKEKAHVDSPVAMGNRHARQAQGATRGARFGGRTGRGRGAVEGEPRVAGEGGRGGRGVDPSGPRGRGSYASMRGGRGRMGRLKPIEVSEFTRLDVGNNADGKRLKKKLGEVGAAALRATMEEASYGALPCPLDDAYKDAVNLNFKIEFEPEYAMEEFGTNPDIDDKPPMLLREALEKMKPFLMEYEGIKSEEEWEEVLSDALKNSPHLKAIVDEYSGPERITAKKQEQELERISKTIPESVPTSVKRFTERALLSLKNNPGWSFDNKRKFMDKLGYHMNQHYK